MQPESQQDWRQHIHDGKKRPARLPLPAAPALPGSAPQQGWPCFAAAAHVSAHSTGQRVPPWPQGDSSHWSCWGSAEAEGRQGAPCPAWAVLGCWGIVWWAPRGCACPRPSPPTRLHETLCCSGRRGTPRRQPISPAAFLWAMLIIMLGFSLRWQSAEEPAAPGRIDPIDPRGSMSFPGDLLKKLLTSLFHFHQLITSCGCSAHPSSTCRNDSARSSLRSHFDTFSTAERGCSAPTGPGHARPTSPFLSLQAHTYTVFSFLKGSPAPD